MEVNKQCQVYVLHELKLRSLRQSAGMSEGRPQGGNSSGVSHIHIYSPRLLLLGHTWGGGGDSGRGEGRRSGRVGCERGRRYVAPPAVH
jgi:hypothetical protein